MVPDVSIRQAQARLAQAAHREQAVAVRMATAILEAFLPARAAVARGDSQPKCILRGKPDSSHQEPALVLPSVMGVREAALYILGAQAPRAVLS